MSILVLLSLLVSLPQFYDASSNFFFTLFCKTIIFEHKYYYRHLFLKKKQNRVIVESIQGQLLLSLLSHSSPGSRSLLLIYWLRHWL